MNWPKLKKKFPKSYQNIREHSISTGITDGRSIFFSFFKSMGIDTTYGFINHLKQYEQDHS